MSVVSVILYHAHLAPLPGDFIGVDVFFVIRGYLRPSLLIADIENGRLSILDFYERRARRILPALFLVIAWRGALAVLGTAMAILFAGPGQLVGRLLSLPLFTGIGVISYSAYPWRRPLLAFLRLRSVEEPSRLAYAGDRSYQPPCDTDISFKPVIAAPMQKCVFPAAAPNPAGKTAILIGDSHATAISHEVRDVLRASGYDVSVMTFGGCIPFPGFSLPGRDCDAANEAVHRHVAAARYDLIVMAARPQALLGDGHPRITFKDGVDGARTEHVLDLIEAGLKRIKAADGMVIYVDPVPQMPFHIGDFVRKSHAFESKDGDIAASTPYAAYLAQDGAMLAILDRLGNDRFIRLSAADILRPDRRACAGAENGVALYHDDNHLNGHGVARLMPALREIVARLQ